MSLILRKLILKKTIEFLNNQYKKLGTIDLINTIERKYKDNIITSKTEAPLVSIAFIIYTSTLMNMYILGRITKPYNKNIIVIAGINHINYIKIFNANGLGYKFYTFEHFKCLLNLFYINRIF